MFPHSVTFAGDVEVYVLLVEPDAGAGTAQAMLHAADLAAAGKRLLLHVTQIPVLHDVDGADGRIADSAARPTVCWRPSRS